MVPLRQSLIVTCDIMMYLKRCWFWHLNVALWCWVFPQIGLSRQNNREVTKIKPLYQQKSRDPHQVSLHACNKAAATVLK